MRTNRRFRLMTAVAGASAMLLLGACSGGSDTAASPSATAPGTASEAPAPSESASTPAAASGTGTADCLKGTWEGDANAAAAQAKKSAEAMGAEVDIKVTGSSLVTFDGSTMTTVYDDQKVVTVATIEGMKLESTTRFDGTLVVDAKVSDGTITTSGGDTSKLTFETTTTMNGEVFEAGDQSELFKQGLEMGSTSTFTCEGDTLVITPDLGELEGQGGMTSGDLAQTLTRR